MHFIDADRVHLCTVICEWDPRKAAANLLKHGVRFADAIAVLEDERAVSIQEDHLDEERWVVIGLDALGRVLVLVYAWRGARIRLISARRATKREMAQYWGVQ